MALSTNKPVIVGLGEVLWDVFEDGPRFGGAPANFCCCAAQLVDGLGRVCMASAVGSDELGTRAIDELQRHGVDVSAVEKVDKVTGRVDVQVDKQGHASYRFADNVAWDNLVWNPSLSELASNAHVICFGTLCQRLDPSRDTLLRFLESCDSGCLRLLDINLRPPFWNPQVIQASLDRCDALKLNEDELPVVSQILGMQGSPLDCMRSILSLYGLRFVALTRGADGAMVLDQSGLVIDEPGQTVEVVDTVGAGDAFTACLVAGLVVHKLPFAAIVPWACRVAGYVCSQPGATPMIPAELRRPFE